MSAQDNENQRAIIGDCNANVAAGEKNDANTSDAETPSSLQPFVDFEQINFKEKVGHGSYGVVYKAVWSNRIVAVKEFGASAEQKAIETEIKQLSRVRHHNIISLFGISADQQSKYLIMEYAEGGSLHNFLHGTVKPFYSTAHAMSWARQCAEGVAYLHAMKPKPLIHRDLKPLNLLLTNKGRHLKICDFGTVADKSTMMTNNKGSAAWMAPEVFEGSKYTEKCDIFSWAIVLWEVLSRQQPFKEIDNTYSILWKIHKGERPPLIKDCPEPIQNLMTSCWATVPDMRPSMQHVVSVMNELASSFPGAEEPLEYEFVNQQIITSNSNNDSVDNYTLDFSSFNSSSYASTQLTPTNPPTIHSNTSSDASTPTNVPKGTDIFNPHSNVPTASIAASTRWDVIPEESDTSVYYPYPSQADALADAVNLAPSGAEAIRHYDTIRNAIGQTLNTPLAPLSIDVDPAAWELNNSNGLNPFAKNDGKERLTVTDAKSLTENNNITNASDDSADLDEDDYDGTDQSLAEMLEPELQPEKPVPNCRESQQIYQEHRRLAKEYLRVDTSLYYAQDFKEKLLLQMNPDERQQKLDILKKMSEQEELLELYRNLKQQAEKLQAEQTNYYATSAPVVHRQTSQGSGNGEVVSDDGWVVVSDQNS